MKWKEMLPKTSVFNCILSFKPSIVDLTSMTVIQRNMVHTLNMITKHGYNIMISQLTLDLKYRLCKAKQIIRALHVRYRKEYAYAYSSSSILHLIEINIKWMGQLLAKGEFSSHSLTFVGECGGAASPITLPPTTICWWSYGYSVHKILVVKQ
jgi:hypothetical protein